MISSFAAAAEEDASKPRFRLHGEIRTHLRHTSSVEVLDEFPFPPPFLPPGESAVFLRTPEPGTSLEISTVTLIGEADLAERLSGRIEVHILDLYNRNPTSSDNKVRLREAYLRFNDDFKELRALPERSSGYVLVGKAARFSRQQARRLESWGLWGTAVGRFEELQVEGGGNVGSNFYWRAALANGNPLFMRDPNALAGDNGTSNRVPGNVTPTLQSGFPILYDAEAGELKFGGQAQVGLGLGWRSVDADGDGYDVLAWYFERSLAKTVDIDGSFYSGDLKLLQGPFFLFPLPIHGDRKREAGVNFEGRWGAWRTFGQYVDQEIAGLPRSGVEIEVAWRYEIAGILIGETPYFRWIQPAVRFSMIDNDFEAPREYPNPAAAWDWRKYDIGIRLGVVPGVDVTAEYSRNAMEVRPDTVNQDEFLLTIRAGF